MSRKDFVFSGEYAIEAPRRAVIEALRDAESWPRWWPQVRSAERIDDRSGWVTIRSILPITLRLIVISELDDPESGIFRARLEGDLVGWIEMRAHSTGPAASLVSYDQECIVAKRGLGRVSTLFRPLLSLNHTLMMRSGMRGLAAGRQRG